MVAPGGSFMRGRVMRAAFGLVGMLAAVPACAGIELWHFDTEYLRTIYYAKEHEPLVPHLARSFENSLAFHRKLFDWTPSEPIVVLMQDFGDYGHGGTSTVPWNFISIGIEPFDYVYETMPANERLNWLMHHELVHVVATEKAAAKERFWRRALAGKPAPTAENPISMGWSWLASPRWYAPRWYHEGIAVFLETWMAGGMGRVLGGYDEMTFRAMVRDDRPFYEIVGLESEGTAIDFQVGQNSYLYGTRFVTWLGLTHGPEKLIAWFSRTDDSARSVTKQFERVYGVPMDEAWASWIAWERGWQAQNLARIRKHPVTADTPVTKEALGSVSRAYVDPDARVMYMAVNYPARPAHLAAVHLDDGREEPLADVLGPALYYVTSLAYDPAGKRLFFTTDNSSGWRDLNVHDLKTGRTQRLVKDCRAGDLVFDRTDRGIWAIQHHDGVSSVVRFPPPYTSWQTLATFPYGKDVFSLDISPDGASLTATAVDVTGRQRLVSMSTAKLRVGDASTEVLHEFSNNAAESFVFSPDGRYLYGSSYFTGVSNIWRYDVAAKTMTPVTNAEAGYFRPLPLADGSLVSFRYTPEGFLPVRTPVEPREDLEAIVYMGQEVVEKHPVLESWNAGSPIKVDLDAVKTGAGRYRPFRSIRLGSAYPVIEGYKSSVAAGYRLHFADPAGMHSIVTTLGVSPDGDLAPNERWHAAARWDHWPWFVRAGHNATDFYDLFGPTKTSRKGTYLGAGWERWLIYERPKTLQLRVRATGFTGLDTLPDYQNVAADVDSYVSTSATLSYAKLRGTIGGVEAERGMSWEVGAANSFVKGDGLLRGWARLDVAIPLPLDHSSLWIRPSAGVSGGDPGRVFSNFYLGGFGNNWVDHLSVRRYRDVESFPGLELNEVEANDFGKLTLEWTLPPKRFESLGRPGFYLNWMNWGVFASGLVANPRDRIPQREFVSVGAQVDFKAVIFANLETTISFGYAQAYEGGRRVGNEVLASLKLLR
jgi:hypothetical protein